ncbi:beta-1,4-galactosyltransferase 5 [Platysternon megacephalum]|uniref:Beta-1,4-galactosyltransferase 5 n=1 Tax=Platysternon megacephalum TaxID=55544 RepID=A0A4D9ELM6_9SAUR|nr:beta-1,4-galactosyltransferase 5 [Platysternon megacephalum]
MLLEGKLFLRSYQPVNCLVSASKRALLGSRNQVTGITESAYLILVFTSSPHFPSFTPLHSFLQILLLFYRSAISSYQEHHFPYTYARAAGIPDKERNPVPLHEFQPMQPIMAVMQKQYCHG